MNRIFQLWLNVNLKTRLISIMILVISILMSTITFISLIRIQNELIETDKDFCRDLSVILSNDIIKLIEHNKLTELNSFIERIYLATSSIYYVRLFNIQGNLSCAFPMYNTFLQHPVDLHSHIISFNYYQFFFNIPFIYSSIDTNYSYIHALLPIVKDSEVLGFLQLGLNYNPSILYTANIVRDVSILVFVSVWLMFMLGAFFNFIIITEPIRKLLVGLRSIALGNFNQKIESSCNGELGDLIISFNEMSERLECYEKKNVAQLTSEKAKLEALVSTIADGAILLDTELRLLFVNQIALKVFQWSNKDLIGKVIFQCLPIHVNEALLPILNNMVQSNCLDKQILQPQEVSIDLNYESLKTYRFFLSTVINQDSQGLNGLVITVQDITRETQLNEAKNQFISNVSHELRTPLCNIGSFLETLIDYSHKLNSQQKSQFLSIAYAETQRLNSLINDVLDLSRLESEYNYVLKPVTLGNTIASIVQASQIIAFNKKVKLIVEIHYTVKKIFANENSLYQVLSNLISNALKFTHKEGRIVIRVYPLCLMYSCACSDKKKMQVIRLEVIDEGLGIDKTFQKQIFDRFMRVENNIHTLEGTGLGLSIVKNIIEKHNSKIAVYSEVGIGTSFWFDLLIIGSNDFT